MADTPRHVRATDRAPISAGSFTRYIPEEDPFKARVLAFRNDDASNLDENNPDNWTADKVRVAAEMFQREDKARQDAVENQQTGDAFVAGHPEYKDSKANAALMTHELNRMFGPGIHPLEHYEKAYESLRSSNFLALDEAELKKQRAAATKQRFEQERARSVQPSEQELYDIPLDELRIRATLEHQRQMQLAGERGGNEW